MNFTVKQCIYKYVSIFNYTNNMHKLYVYYKKSHIGNHNNQTNFIQMHVFLKNANNSKNICDNPNTSFIQIEN